MDNLTENQMPEEGWKQRLENLKRAFAQLEKACARAEYSDLELAGLVQTYQFTFELCWKTMKDLLTSEGYDVKSPRETIRKAFELALIPDQMKVAANRCNPGLPPSAGQIFTRFL